MGGPNKNQKRERKKPNIKIFLSSMTSTFIWMREWYKINAKPLAVYQVPITEGVGRPFTRSTSDIHTSNTLYKPQIKETELTWVLQWPHPLVIQYSTVVHHLQSTDHQHSCYLDLTKGFYSYINVNYSAVHRPWNLIIRM